jgi:phage terminase small subunit
MGSRGPKSANDRATLRVVPPAPAREANHAPPDHLSPAMKAWWRSVLADFELDEHHRFLLESAAGAWDRMTEARAAIAEHGLTYVDDRGAPKARPEVAIERDARIAFARLVRELDLDEAPPPEPRGRPPGLRSNRR